MSEKIVTFFILFFFCGCNDFDPKIGEKINHSRNKNDPDIFLTTFETSSFEKNNKNWIIKSEIAKIFEKKKKTLMDKVIFITYDESEKKINHVISDFAELHNESHDIILKENVVIINHQGTKITGDLFFWNNKSRNFTSPQKVTVIKKDGSIISGTGFKANQQLGNIEFQSRARGELTPNNENDFFYGF